MKRWAWITIVLYFCLVSVLFIPLVSVCFFMSPITAAGLMWHWGFVLFQVILVLIQLLLLVVPVRVEQELRIKKRHLFAQVFAVGFLISVLLLGLVSSILIVLIGEEVPNTIANIVIAIAGINWVVWGVILWKSSKKYNPREFMVGKIRSGLIRGSLLELLVAIPSHIYVRWRGDCCSPAFTFAAIEAGVAIMLAAFGPGIFFIFAKRLKMYRRD